MKKPFFEPIDFNNKPYDNLKPEVCAEIANAKLEKESQSWPTVYGIKTEIDFRLFGQGTSEDDTHTAKLAFIEELPKKECVHKPKGFHDDVGSFTVTPVCRYCNVELKATWSKK